MWQCSVSLSSPSPPRPSATQHRARKPDEVRTGAVQAWIDKVAQYRKAHSPSRAPPFSPPQRAPAQRLRAPLGRCRAALLQPSLTHALNPFELASQRVPQPRNRPLLTAVKPGEHVVGSRVHLAEVKRRLTICLLLEPVNYSDHHNSTAGRSLSKNRRRRPFGLLLVSQLDTLVSCHPRPSVSRLLVLVLVLFESSHPLDAVHRPVVIRLCLLACIVTQRQQGVRTPDQQGYSSVRLTPDQQGY